MKVICEVSNKHCHLTESELKESGIKPTKLKDVSQPGQWATNEKYNDGKEDFRIIMPTRKINQFELSLTDWIKRFGRNKEPVWKRGSEEGYVVVVRHLHVSPKQADELGVKDGGFVSIKKDGIRAGKLDKILVRVDPNFDMRVHLDTDEANALFIKNGEEVDLIV